MWANTSSKPAINTIAKHFTQVFLVLLLLTLNRYLSKASNFFANFAQIIARCLKANEL